MNGKIDDVRLPFSTVDPIMGDLFSIFWEPEMLQSMGRTVNILATEVGCTSFPLSDTSDSVKGPHSISATSSCCNHPWRSHGIDPASRRPHEAFISP